MIRLTGKLKRRGDAIAELLMDGLNAGDTLTLIFFICTGILKAVIDNAYTDKQEKAKTSILKLVDLMHESIENYQPEKDKEK